VIEIAEYCGECASPFSAFTAMSAMTAFPVRHSAYSQTIHAHLKGRIQMSALIRHVALVSESKAIDHGQVSIVAAALQKQVTRDFGPLWGINGTVDGFDRLESVPADYWPVIIADDIEEPGAAGYHQDEQGRPFALVQADVNWSLTASHETLEMLADPGGMTTVAGAPPPQAPEPISTLERVLYLEEVCDPCEAEEFAYTVNGVRVSDFITPHYYDPSGATGLLYSFRGSVTEPHIVGEGGYVSFGNPIDNHWFQIVVVNGQTQVKDLGVITTTRGKSLRESVDRLVRRRKKAQHYRTKSPTGKPPGKPTKLTQSSAARAKALRSFIEKLK
jgi:hypothetical protein